MKRLLSVWCVFLLVVQLAACGLNSEEKNIETLRLINLFDDSVTEIKVISEKMYFADGALLAFQSSLSVENLGASLAEMNPEFSFIALDDKQLLMMSEVNYPYTLFSKNVADSDGDLIDDVYVVVNESTTGNRNDTKICFPYHLTDYGFVFEEDNGICSLDGHWSDPFYNFTTLRTSPTVITDIADFYQDCGYAIQYEGGNTAGGSISVYSNYESPLESPVPLYQILVMSDGSDRCAMQYCLGIDVYKSGAEEVVEKYVGALNSKDVEAYLDCYEEIDSGSVDVFLDNVKSCTLNSSELFWMDQSNDEYILKVDRTLISENGKLMGSFGTGEVDCTDYWLIRMVDGEAKIHCQYVSYRDTVSELTVYKEFEKDET